MKKLLSMVLVVALMVTTLAACGGNGGNNGSAGNNGGSGNAGGSGDKVEISMLGAKVEIHDALQKAIDTYMGENPNVKITLETVGGGDDAGAALKTKLNGGSMPTIYSVAGPQAWNEWADYLEDLSDQPWVEHVAEAALTQATDSNGRVLGLPYAVEGYGFVYNKRVFAAANIDAENLKTFAEIDEAFGKLKTMIDNGDLKEEFPILEAVMEFPVKETWVTGLHTVNVALNQEFASENEAYNTDTLGFTYSDQLQKIIDLQVKYTKNAENPSALTAVDYSVSLGGGLAIERVAVVQQGNWINTEVSNVDPELADDLGIIPIPLEGVKEDGSIPVGVPSCYNVNSQASDDQKQAAKDFLNWLFQSEEGKNIVINEFLFVPAFTNYDGLEPQDALSRAVKSYIDSDKTTAWVFPGCPNGFMDKFGENVQAYVSDSISWAELVSDCQTEWTKLRDAAN